MGLKEKISEWYGRHFLWVELLTAILGTCLILSWIWYAEKFDEIDATLSGNRGTLYGALVSLFGTLLGFSIATVSIILGLASESRLAIIRNSKHYKTLWKVFNSTNRWLGAATIAALFALVIDKDTAPSHLILSLNLLLFVVSVVRISRCVWVLEKVIDIVSSPSKARDGTQAAPGDKIGTDNDP